MPAAKTEAPAKMLVPAAAETGTAASRRVRLAKAPAAKPTAKIADASEERFQALFSHASRGDPAAQRELVRLRLAYLTWAYAGRQARKCQAQASLS